jgi:hypothetical protein
MDSVLSLLKLSDGRNENCHHTSSVPPKNITHQFTPKIFSGREEKNPFGRACETANLVLHNSYWWMSNLIIMQCTYTLYRFGIKNVSMIFAQSTCALLMAFFYNDEFTSNLRLYVGKLCCVAFLPFFWWFLDVFGSLKASSYWKISKKMSKYGNLPSWIFNKFVQNSRVFWPLIFDKILKLEMRNKPIDTNHT